MKKAQLVTVESRTAIGRSKLFLSKARLCDPGARIDFEAYIEASIVFARAALHRLQTKYQKRPGWKPWWASLEHDAAIQFFRDHRNWVLKEASLKINQIIYMGSIPPSKESEGEKESLTAERYYCFERDEAPTKTIEKHLRRLEAIDREAHRLFDHQASGQKPGPTVKDQGS